MPSVRELASRLAVNQNTILKVYNELSRDNIVKISRGEGTFVSSGKQMLTDKQKQKQISGIIRESAVRAIQLDIPLEQTVKLLKNEYKKIKHSKNESE